MTPTNLPSVSVGFPVYNEEMTAGDVLREAVKLLSASGIDYEILVCDDGSKDASWDVISGVAKETPGIKLLRHEKNRGIHYTFEELYKKASKDFVFVNSADKQWPTAILFELLPLTKDWDVIIANRINKPYGPVRQFISWVFNAVPRVLFSSETFDAGAVKLMRREIIERFEIISKTPFSEAERLIRASKSGYRITHHPVRVNPRRSGKSHAIKLRLLCAVVVDVAKVWRYVYFEEPRLKKRNLR